MLFGLIAEAGGDGLEPGGDRRQPIGVPGEVYFRTGRMPDPEARQLAVKAGHWTVMTPL
ncbi:hypothetical protein AB0E12_09890 [Micromonospora chersina]|uniref:hypothetical protein n=1 Tax=Micromonospora chersina TaxID=47854 RepID=UPI0033FBDD70